MSLSTPFQQVAIGDCCQIISGSTPSRLEPEYWNGNVNWFTPKDLSGIKSKYVSEAPEKITQLGLQSCSAALLPPKSLLLSSRAPIGHIAINLLPACTNQGFKSLVTNSGLDVEYLYYAIKNIVPQLQAIGNGATFKEISKAILSKVKIPVPPLAEQQKIASILDAADGLRQKDQQLVERYTALSQSLFLEMFGDPVTNPRAWPYAQLNNLVSKLGDGLHGTPEYSDDGEYFFINGNNLNHGAIEFSPYTKKVSKSEFEKHKKTLNNSTILVSINGSIGKVAFYNGEKIILGKSACYFNTNETLINKIYLFRLIESPYFLKYAMGSATGSTIKNVSLKTMRELPVPVPPIKMQTQFAESIELIEAQKLQAKHSLDKSEALFNSLLQRAFTGELTAKMAA